MLKMALKKKDTDKDTFQGMTVHGSEVLPWDTVTAPSRRSISLVRMQIQDKKLMFYIFKHHEKIDNSQGNSLFTGQNKWHVWRPHTNFIVQASPNMAKKTPS